MAKDAKQQLIEFLDARVFQPALSIDPLDVASAEDRKLLKSVQTRVRESRVRYIADYPHAIDIKSNFLQDLNSKPGQALANDMWLLKLTRFEDVRADFLSLCKQLGL
jgi:hypothetical protein